MNSSSAASIVVLFPQDQEGWIAFAQRICAIEGNILAVIAGREGELIAEPDQRHGFIKECKKKRDHLRVATKHPAIAAELRSAGIRVLDRTSHMRTLLEGHAQLDDALRLFSPHLWRQQLKSRLQKMGLLSVPKLRIFSLAGLSILLFCFVLFRLLPSADISIVPRQESVSQTINIFLVQSGSTATLSPRVRRMPLTPITVRLSKVLTFDHISKEFIGSTAQVELTIINKSSEQYALRNGTRFTNQAGMVFRIVSHAIVEPGQEVIVRAKAEDSDLYGQIIGERGNVPAGLRWEIPGLSAEERSLVYAENKTPARGGTSAYRTVLRQEDLDLARKRLEQELLATAKIAVEERRDELSDDTDEELTILNYAELTTISYHDISLPTQFLGQEVTSIPVEGTIQYSVYAYSTSTILTMLLKELRSHVRDGRKLLDEGLSTDDLVVHVIDYSDDLTWIKLTVDLAATEEYILDPLSPTGALFSRSVRERVTNVPQSEALRILRNMPEVERVDIRQWPPWERSMPGIPSHIDIHTVAR